MCAMWVVHVALVLVTMVSALAIVASAQFVTCPPVAERPVYDLVNDFGAVGDNTTLNTQAFQDAIAAISQAGGGELRVGPGVFLTAPFSLTNCMKLNLYDAKSFIQAITSIADWPVGPKPTAVDDWDVDELGDTAAHAVGDAGGQAPDLVYQDFISAHNVTDVMIDGPGTIDGGGYMWWGPARAGTLKYDRGVLLGVYDSQYFTLRDVQLQNSPMFNVKPYQTQHVWAERLRIFNPADSHNTDGFDPQSCNNVTLTDSYFHTGDDAVAVKTTLRPATNILVRNLTVTAGHCGMCIGSGAKGGASNISVVDSHFVSVVNGFCFKGFRGVGGTVHNYSANNIVIDWANYSAIQLTDFYPGGDNSSSVVPIVYDVRVMNMVATKVGRWPAVLRGLNDSVMTQLLFSNVTVMEWGKPYECESVQGTYENVSPSMGGGACPGITESGGERIVDDAREDVEDDEKNISGLLQWAKMAHTKAKARTVAKT